MIKKYPLFSIVIPTYNRASTIGATLQSLARQTFDDFEVVVVDDGSTDNTPAVVAPFLEDNRFAYHTKENEERAVARNWGIDRSKGKYITFLDSDDGYYPDCLLEAHRFVSVNNQPRFFHLGYEIKDQKGRVHFRSAYQEKQLNKKLLSGNLLSCIHVFVARELLLLDKFNETPALIGSEDYELWLRLAAKHPLLYCNKVGGYMLQHHMRSVVNINRDTFNERMKVLLALVESNPDIKKGYTKRELQVFHNHTRLYWSLHLAMAGYKKESSQILARALMHAPALVASRKFLGIIKTLLLK